MLASTKKLVSRIITSSIEKETGKSLKNQKNAQILWRSKLF
ncbi:hypothetical protein AMCSP05_002130 [Streptococcus pneumoniae 2070425]|nr:hypothetical protein SP670_2325 [Streptococcus pneumoniae 670-6B]EHD98537.1 hypothetical protein SPAR39_2167 [Streptococcus pneumoniae GA16242]EJG44743.1 hypothetical protein AMCSP05_002130 [Streptococcus pneumoniae 2070425]